MAHPSSSPVVPAEPFLSRAATADHLLGKWGIRRSVATLNKLACLGGGPPFVKAGRQALYARSDVDAWAAGLLREPSGGSRAA